MRWLRGGRATPQPQTSFSVPPERAIARADCDAFAIYGPAAGVVRDVVLRSLKDGSSIDEAATALDAAAAHANVPAPAFIEPRAVGRRERSAWWLIAHYEIQRAAIAGQIDLYRAAQVQTLRWSAGDCCERCYAADGSTVVIGAPFRFVDAVSSPAHIGCTCATMPADDDLGDWTGGAENRARAKRGGLSAAEYEAKTGRVHPYDAARRKFGL